MTRKIIKQRTVSALLASAIILSATVVSAGEYGYSPDAGVLNWPLMSQFTGEPRKAVWTSFEYQDYSYASSYYPQYLHPGIDVVGSAGDKVMAVTEGELVFAANLKQCQVDWGDPPYTWTGYKGCRIYMTEHKADPRYLFYYSHLAVATGTYISSELEDYLNEAAEASAPEYDKWDLRGENMIIGEDEVLGAIADFSGFNHAHLSIFDMKENYDCINPLTAPYEYEDPGGGGVVSLLPENMDDEPPTIGELEFYRAGEVYSNSPSESIPQGECDVLDKSYSYDIVAYMEDTFYTTDPDPDTPGDPLGVQASAVNSIGIYRAEMTIRKVNSPEDSDYGTEVRSYMWYEMDQVPYLCVGEVRGSDCPDLSAQIADLDTFWTTAVNDSNGALNGAPPWDTPFINNMFSQELSLTQWDNEEEFAHVMTSEWGEVADSWDPSGLENGYYQITVEAWDQAGSGIHKNALVYLHDDPGSFDASEAAPDVYARDNPVECGTIPSNAGGQKHYVSPDIVITDPAVDRAAVEAFGDNYAGFASGLLQQGENYNVWVRVHNNRCAPADNIAVKVFATIPSMIYIPEEDVDEDDIEEITNGEFWGNQDGVDNSLTGGLVSCPGEGEEDNAKLIGPFPWTPADTGHVCMIAKIRADGDPEVDDVVTHVKDSNNLAQRNLQFEGDGSFRYMNPMTVSADIGLEFNCNGFPVSNEEAEVEFRVEHHPAIESAWANVPDTEMEVDGGDIVLRIKKCNILMPATTLPAATVLEASVDLTLPHDAQSGEYVVYFSEYIDGYISSGMAFSISSVIVI